jgi:hypothetical protein
MSRKTARTIDVRLNNSPNKKLFSTIVSEDYRITDVLSYLNQSAEFWGDKCFEFPDDDYYHILVNGKKYRRTIKVHAYLIKYPDVRMAGKIVKTHCKNLKCVNPNHLKAIRINTKDAILEANAKRVRKLYLEGSSKRELAERFGVTISAIKKIVEVN